MLAKGPQEDREGNLIDIGKIDQYHIKTKHGQTKKVCTIFWT